MHVFLDLDPSVRNSPLQGKRCESGSLLFFELLLLCG